MTMNTVDCRVRLPGRRQAPGRAPGCAVGAAACLVGACLSVGWPLPAAAQVAGAAPASVPVPSPVPGPATSQVDVISVTALTQTSRTQRSECWSTLETERQFEVNQANEQAKARPWLLREIRPVSGAAMGMATGAYLAARYASRIWIAPAVLGGAAAGAVVGPFGVALGIGGGVAAHLLSHKLPLTIAGSMVGTLLGMALWHILIPPPKPATPASVTDIPVQHFVELPQCQSVARLEQRPSGSYRVTYVYGGATQTADVPYDPGDTLRVDASGKPLAAGRGTD